MTEHLNLTNDALKPSTQVLAYYMAILSEDNKSSKEVEKIFDSGFWIADFRI